MELNTWWGRFVARTIIGVLACILIVEILAYIFKIEIYSDPMAWLVVFIFYFGWVVGRIIDKYFKL